MYHSRNDYFYDLFHGDAIAVFWALLALFGILLVIYLVYRIIRRASRSEMVLVPRIARDEILRQVTYFGRQRATNLNEAATILTKVIGIELALAERARPLNPLTRINSRNKLFFYQFGDDVLKNNKAPAEEFDQLIKKINNRNNQILEKDATIERHEETIKNLLTTVANYEKLMGETHQSKLDTIKRNSDLLETAASQPTTVDEAAKVANAKNEGKVDIYEKFFATAPATPARATP